MHRAFLAIIFLLAASPLAVFAQTETNFEPPQPPSPAPTGGFVPPVFSDPVNPPPFQGEQPSGGAPTGDFQPPSGKMPFDNFKQPPNDFRQGGRDMNSPKSQGRFEGGFTGEPEAQFGREESGEGMDKRELERMKSRLNGIMAGYKNIKKAIDRLKKQKIAVPSEYETLVAEIDLAVGVVKNATELTDEVQSAMDLLDEKSEDIREIGPKLALLEQLPKALKRAEQQLKKVKKEVARAKKAATSVGADVATRIEAKVAAIEASIAELKSAAPTDPEEAMDLIREKVYEAMEDLRDDLTILQNISNLSKMLSGAKKEIARIEQEAARLKKQKKDVTALLEIVAQMKEKHSSAESIAASDDKEAIFEFASDAERLHNDALEELARLKGQKTNIDKELEGKDSSSYLPTDMQGFALSLFERVSMGLQAAIFSR